MSTDRRREVHYDRLHKAESRPRCARGAARIACHCLVGVFHVVTSLLARLRGGGVAGGTRSVVRPARVVLTGTFFADNWVEAHVRPLALSPSCEHVWVAADRPFVPMEHVTYVCAPWWLRRLIGRTPARSLVFVLTAFLHRADVVGGFHLLCNGLLALLVARMLGGRALYFCVGGWAEFVDGGVHGGNHLFARIGREDRQLEHVLLRAVRQFDLIATMGTGARELLLQRGVKSPVFVMPGGIDPERYVSGAAQPHYDLVTICRVVPVKRLDVFLEVVRLVAERIPDVRAVIVGDGSELETLKTRTHTLGLDEHVHFPGRQQNTEQWLDDARVFVLTSDSEGLALSLMEAAMMGLPAVVSDVGDLGDLVVDGVNGWRPPPRRAELFAERIVKLLTDDDLYKDYARAARQRAMVNSVEAITSRWGDILAPWGFGASPMLRARHSGGAVGFRWPSRRRLWDWARRSTCRSGARSLSLVHPQIWLGRRFRRNLRFLSRTESWSRDEQTAYQLSELKRIVTLAYERSPYYRRLFRSCGFEPRDLRKLEDLQGLPTIDAGTVRDHLHSLFTAQRLPATADPISTGGTGGAPLHFYIGTDRSIVEYSHLIASWRRTGYRLGTPLAVFRGRVVAPDRTGLRHEYDPLLRHHHYSSFHMVDGNMRAYLDHIRGLGPCFLHVYPSSIAALARFIRQAEIEPPSNIGGIIAESEIVYAKQRRMVEEVFGCRFFSCYGHTEKLVLAAECEHATDYHVWPTYGYFELLDEDGKPVTKPGEQGEIVGTGFVNTVVPFIRYRTGDFATLVGDRCNACGRAHTLIRDVRGHRTQEVLIATDGSEIPWAAINMHDGTFANVLQFQFQQDTPGKARLKIVPAETFADEDRQRIRNDLEYKLKGRLSITIELTDRVGLSQVGKAIYVDRASL